MENDIYTRIRNIGSSMEMLSRPNRVSDSKPLLVNPINIADQVIDEIKKFESTLDAEHETGMVLANFGSICTIQVSSINTKNPGLIIITGYDNATGNNVTLVQHYTQLNFLLMAIPNPEPTKPPRRIGFISE